MLYTLEECRDQMPRIWSALHNFHNGRGAPVFGKDKQGNWVKIRKARVDRGTPYGFPADDSPEFVLRAVELRKD